MTEVGIKSVGGAVVCVGVCGEEETPSFPQRLALALIKQQDCSGCFPLMAQQR